MSFVIACTKGGKTYGVSSFNGSFDLIPLDSNSALSKVHNYPQRVIANKILNWIQDNDDTFSEYELSVQDYAKFLR
jgi:hypothetical protein